MKKAAVTTAALQLFVHSLAYIKNPTAQAVPALRL